MFIIYKCTFKCSTNIIIWTEIEYQYIPRPLGSAMFSHYDVKTGVSHADTDTSGEII